MGFVGLPITVTQMFGDGVTLEPKEVVDVLVSNILVEESGFDEFLNLLAVAVVDEGFESVLASLPSREVMQRCFDFVFHMLLVF
jgi:hypothetical protein